MGFDDRRHSMQSNSSDSQSRGKWPRWLWRFVRQLLLQVLAGLIATTIWSFDINSLPIWQWTLGWVLLVTLIEWSVKANVNAEPRREPSTESK